MDPMEWRRHFIAESQRDAGGGTYNAVDNSQRVKGKMMEGKITRRLSPFTLGCLFLIILPSSVFAEPKRPNVLFIAIDDQNDWIGCLGGHPQVQTPHIDALAKRGTLFTNAH